MKKRLFLLFIFFLVFNGLILAQIQGGFGLESRVLSCVLNENHDLSTKTLDAYLPYYFLYTLQLSLVKNYNMLDVGLGYKVWTLSLMFASYPVVYCDLVLGSFILHGGFGGLLVTMASPFGATALASSCIFVPELGAYFKIGKTFQVGLAAYMPCNSDFAGALPVIFCVSGRFVWDLIGHVH